MKGDNYQLLLEASISRIEREWSLVDSQRCVMRAIAALSFGEGQSWALIPCQAKLATALRLHKATVSRAISSCIRLGILERFERQHETLYRVRPNASLPRNGSDASDAAMRDLHELQRTRLQGKAEANGQLRIDGILESEELEMPADAFEASMSMPEPPADESTATSESDSSFHRRLAELSSQPSRPSLAKTAPSGVEARWLSATAKLGEKQRRVMEALREECRATNPRSEADLIQYAYRWRNEVAKRPRLIEELVSEHKYLRLTGRGFAVTCKFLDSKLKQLDKITASVDSS